MRTSNSAVMTALLVVLAVGLVHCSTSSTPPVGDSASDAPVDAACTPACGVGRSCCSDRCVNPANDPHNCGGCGVECVGATPFCDSGSCKATPCSKDGGTCPAGSTCCGGACCSGTQICCLPEGPLDMGPACTEPTGTPPTCPQGCAPLCVSDRELKRDLIPVDDEEVLEALARVPISTWSYVSDDPSVRHLGPTAQDLGAAFGLGGTDRAYSPVDAHGIAFAAIRGLYAKVQAQELRLERLEEENARLRDLCR